jgi:hypothetical protein
MEVKDNHHPENFQNIDQIKTFTMSALVIAACDSYWFSLHGKLPEVHQPNNTPKPNQGEIMGEWFQLLLHAAPPTYHDCVSLLSSCEIPIDVDPLLPTTETTMRSLSERWERILRQTVDVYIHPLAIYESSVPFQINRINLALTRQHAFDITWIMKENHIIGLLFIRNQDSEKHIHLISESISSSNFRTHAYLLDATTQSNFGPYTLHESQIPEDFEWTHYMSTIHAMIEIQVDPDVIRDMLHHLSRERQVKRDSDWLSNVSLFRDVDPTSVPMNMLPPGAFQMRTFEDSTFQEDMVMHVKYVYVDSPEDAFSGWSTLLRDALHYYRPFLTLYKNYVRPSEWLSFLDRFANGIPLLVHEYPPEQVVPIHLVPCPAKVPFRFTGKDIESMISDIRVMYEWITTMSSS